MTAGSFLRAPDPVVLWIRLELLTRHLVGWRLEHGATPTTDEQFDKLMRLRARVAQRLTSWPRPGMKCEMAGAAR